MADRGGASGVISKSDRRSGRCGVGKPSGSTRFSDSDGLCTHVHQCYIGEMSENTITRWHPLTKAILLHLGFVQDWDKSPNGDMVRGNWRLWPEHNHADNTEMLDQYPLTLEHDIRGICLKIYEPPMLDLLRMLG